MEKSMELLLSRLDQKLNEQTKHITTAVTASVMEAMDERFKTILEENAQLKDKIFTLEKKLNTMEKEKRKFNLVFFGIEEAGKSEAELVDHIKETVIESGTNLNSNEISSVYRIGKKDNNKNRPVVVSFTSVWKKHYVLKNKRGLPPGVYVKEDFSKEVLEKRKQLQLQVEEEKKKGNIAFLKYDKIIVKKSSGQPRDKRKREESGSPKSSTNKKVNTEENSSIPLAKTKDNVKPNLLNYIERGKPASPGMTSKNL